VVSSYGLRPRRPTKASGSTPAPSGEGIGVRGRRGGRRPSSSSRTKASSRKRGARGMVRTGSAATSVVAPVGDDEPSSSTFFVHPAEYDAEHKPIVVDDDETMDGKEEVNIWDAVFKHPWDGPMNLGCASVLSPYYQKHLDRAEEYWRLSDSRFGESQGASPQTNCKLDSEQASINYLAANRDDINDQDDSTRRPAVTVAHTEQDSDCIYWQGIGRRRDSTAGIQTDGVGEGMDETF
jgi:hypothetical protein